MSRSLILATSTLVFAGDAAQDAARDRLNLQGTWQVVAAENEGKAIPREEIVQMEVIFSGDRVLIRGEDKDAKKREAIPKFTFTLDPAHNPKHIDFKYLDAPKKGLVEQGIYHLDGNDLKICMQQDPKGERPRRFVTALGDQLSLIVLRRFK